MSRAALQLKVAGQTYRVVTSATADELERLAEAIEDRMFQATAPGRRPTQQSLVLAALTLAHELEEERERRRCAEERYRESLRTLLQRIDAVLEETALPSEGDARPTRDEDEDEAELEPSSENP